MHSVYVLVHVSRCGSQERPSSQDSSWKTDVTSLSVIHIATFILTVMEIGELVSTMKEVTAVASIIKYPSVHISPGSWWNFNLSL